jgi:Serine/threonine protein kinase
MKTTLAAGMTVSRYRIVDPIGKGGMGEVYKAWDATLDRAIAIKILPPELVQNPERVRRFVLEAKSASSLNHPHIITIYEVGEARLNVALPDAGDEGSHVHYIAMELIDGETLGRKIRTGNDLRTMIGWLAQAADGLAKAHAAGIVHRDLKPDNIMVTRDGYAKVLDFGLAKLVDRAPSLVADDVTREGFIAGTLGYMSPEQVQGQTVDARSDIFSFGCILYEAATRQRPFQADSDIDLMHKIVHDKPEPIDRINPNVPSELRRIVRRCLAKEPEQRYQSMKDVAIELREIHAGFEQLSITRDASGSDERPTVIIRVRPTPKRWLAILSLALSIVAAGGGFVFWRLHRMPRFTPDLMQLTKLTNSGNVSVSAISPDGRYLVHDAEENGQFSLWLKQIATGSDVQIVKPSPARIWSTDFSPDNNFVLYVAAVDAHSVYRALYRIPVLGGSSAQVISDIEASPAFSPDGKSFAFTRRVTTTEDTQVVVADASGAKARIAATTKFTDDERFTEAGCAWTPDGKRIVVVLDSWKVRPRMWSLVSIDPQTGRRTTVFAPQSERITSIKALPDSNGIMMISARDGASLRQLRFVSIPSGEATRIWADTNADLSLSLTADGRTATLTQRVRSAAISIADLNGEHPRLVSPPDAEVSLGDIAPNGRAFTGGLNGQRTLWAVNDDGSAHPVPNAVGPVLPSASSDGRTIVYSETGTGPIYLCAVNSDGSNNRRLIPEPVDKTYNSISPDGQSVVYIRNQQLLRIPLGGGTPVVLANDVAENAVYSLDGQYILTDRYVHDKGHAELKIIFVPAGGGNPVATVEPRERLPNVGWGPGNTIAALDAQGNISLRPLLGGPWTQLTHFTSGRTFDFGFSADGKHSVLIRGDERNDVVMLTNFR